jgi:hypothetical protein
MTRPKGRSPGYVPEYVFVIRNGCQYLSGCRHAYCPTWVYLSSRCVRWWKTRRHAERHAEAIRFPAPAVGLSPMPDACVEEVEYRRIGKSPEGKEVSR